MAICYQGCCVGNYGMERMRKILLCTDLDRTLIPNGPQVESPGARDMFADFVARDDVQLAYVTGRNLRLITDSIEQWGLPVPDFAIADVGTSIYHLDNHVWHHWQPWEDEIAVDWRGRGADDVHALLAGVAGLRLQEAEKQNTHKLSYYVDLELDETRVIAEAEARLGAEGVRVKLIWSIDEEARVGLLDVLPESASKRHAIGFLMQSGFYDADHTLFAGDSGNDINVIMSPIHSIIVANADDDVLSAIAETPPPNAYMARGDFFGLNGCYASGILEGVAHFCPEFGPVIGAIAARRRAAGPAGPDLHAA